MLKENLIEYQKSIRLFIKNNKKFYNFNNIYLMQLC